VPVFGQSQFPNYVCKTLRVILSTCIFAQIPGCYLWAQLSTAIYIFRTLTKHTHLCYLPPTKSDGTPTTSDVTPTKSKQMEIHFTSIGIKVWYNWQHFGIKLGSVCDQSGVIWGSFFDHARIILGALGVNVHLQQICKQQFFCFWWWNSPNTLGMDARSLTGPFTISLRYENICNQYHVVIVSLLSLLCPKSTKQKQRSSIRINKNSIIYSHLKEKTNMIPGHGSKAAAGPCHGQGALGPWGRCHGLQDLGLRDSDWKPEGPAAHGFAPAPLVRPWVISQPSVYWQRRFLLFLVFVLVGVALANFLFCPFASPFDRVWVFE
jgi:hypothetical protein